MSRSLFRRLCEAHPESLQRLSYQYRMNGDVMTLCNDLTYSGRLRCGNPQVEDQRLYLPHIAAIPSPSFPFSPSTTTPPSKTHGWTSSSSASWQGQTPPDHSQLRHIEDLTPWLTDALDPAKRVIFLDTDAISPDDDDDGDAEEDGGSARLTWGAATGRPFAGLELRAAAAAVSVTGEEGGADGGDGRAGRPGSLVNRVECDVVRLVSWGLDTAGFDLGEAGVISPYRSQVREGARVRRGEVLLIFALAWSEIIDLASSCIPDKNERAFCNLLDAPIMRRVRVREYLIQKLLFF